MFAAPRRPQSTYWSLISPSGALLPVTNPSYQQPRAIADIQPTPAPAPPPDVPLSANNVVRSIATGIPIAGGLANEAPARPKFGSDEYVNAIAKKHGVEPDYARGLVHSQSATSGVEGFPIIGGPLVHTVGPYAAALAQPLTGAGAGGGSISERAAKNAALEQDLRADYKQAHPREDLAAHIIGGTAITAPFAATGLGARALGLTGSLPGGVARGAATSAAISAADAATRGGDVTWAAGIGGLLGGGVPIVGRAVGAAAAPVVDRLRRIINPSEEAARQAGSAINRELPPTRLLNRPGEPFAPRPADLPEVDLAALEARAQEIHAVLHPRAQEHRTTPVLGTNEKTIVGGGAKVDLEPRQIDLLRGDEVPAKLPSAHAEITVLWKAFARG